MLHDIVKKGSVDRSVTVRIIDSTDGTPETGVVYNTTGIDLWYRREGAAVVSITEATLAALTTAHTDGGFLTISHGYYRLDLPDAAFATGANHVDFGGTVTGMVVIGGRVRLVDYDPEDTVRMGLTALPNAAANAAGGLPVSTAGALSMDGIKSDTAAILVDTSTTLDGRIPAALVGGRMDSNASALNGDATAAAKLAKSASVIFEGSVTGAATTTTLIDSALTETAADFWKGRIIIFTSGALKYQATDITAFDPATDKLTFTALTAAPAAAVTYVIV